MATLPQHRDLSSFVPAGYDKGRPVWVQALWFAVMNTVFSAWWCPARWRVFLLRLFGASVGEGVLIRHRVRILWPWKLTIGDNAWVGEGAWLLNLEPIVLGASSCVSQEALICTGSHDYQSSSFGYRNAPVTVGDGAWVAARAVLLPGVRIGAQAVVGSGVTVSHDVPALTRLTGAGLRPITIRPS